MSLKDSLVYLLFWGTIGAFIFSLFVVFVFRSGVVYISRKEDGTLKNRIPLKGYFAMFFFLLAIVGFLVTANYFSISRLSFDVGFVDLFVLNGLLYLLLFVFDTAFIDGFVLGIWRPNFLRLSDKLDSESMGQHIIRSIPVGIIFGLFISGISTVISWIVLLR